MSIDAIIAGTIGYVLGLLTRFFATVLSKEYEWWGEDQRKKDATKRMAIGDFKRIAKNLKEDWEIFRDARVPFFDLRKDIFLEVRQLRELIAQYETYFDTALVSEAKRVINNMITLFGKCPGSTVEEWVQNVNTDWLKLCQELVKIAERLG